MVRVGERVLSQGRFARRYRGLLIFLSRLDVRQSCRRICDCSAYLLRLLHHFVNQRFLRCRWEERRLNLIDKELRGFDFFLPRLLALRLRGVGLQ